ncbi:hypothetical protein KKB69_01205 [Patescibacteria group bacterium]|nr:hypothetical protein [Patescibacteria group bacterium]
MGNKIKKILQAHNILHQRSKEVLASIVKNKWIESFVFTPRHGELDIHGIDLTWSFRPGPNGEVGISCAQEKTRVKDIKVHFKKYPCMPLYLLRPGDSKEQIEYAYITLILACNSYNAAEKLAIEKRKNQLRGKVRKKERRVWLNWLDFK